MSKKAWAFVYTILFLALLQIGLSFSRVDITPSIMLIFAILTILATVSQIFEIEGTFRNAYYPHSVFFLGASILLDPLLFSLVVIIPHLIEWIEKRLKNSTQLRAWYIQPFNISTHVLAGFTTYSLYHFFKDLGVLDSLLGPVIIFMLALIYTFINHLLIGLALLLARGLSFHESAVLKMGSLMPDIVLGCMGYIFVSLWNNEPWMLPLALSPLVLMYQALKIPQLTQDAQIDSKTGLLNAKYFNKILSTEFDTAQHNNSNISFLMCDLDFMRNVNNTYGHLAGDIVLAGIGKVILQTIPDKNHAGRFGGEEFAVLLTDVSIEEARRIGETIRRTVSETEFKLETYPDPVKVTISIGVASYPQNAKNITELIHSADMAVYQAKKNGRNRVMTFSDLTQEEIEMLYNKPTAGKFKDNAALELQLKQALDEGQFEMYYQPKVELKSDLIFGMEALIRWNHPERGIVPPSEFIPAAEHTGLILPLSKWILEESCRQVKVWNTFTRRHSPLTVSVNFSAMQFQCMDVFEIVSNIVKETGIKPGWLEIELTESILLENTTYTINTLNKLKDMGVKLALDDFGIGYSSLSYLRDFPIDTLKIDRSFITGMDKDEINQALVEVIITFAAKLKLSVIAEGVETESERSQLLNFNCYAGQGYLFAKPLPAFSVDELLMEEKSVQKSNRVLSLRNFRSYSEAHNKR